MVLVLHGNSEKGAHVRINLCYLIYRRYLIRSGAVTNRFFFGRKDLISFMRAQHVLSYKLTLEQCFLLSFCLAPPPPPPPCPVPPPINPIILQDSLYQGQTVHSTQRQ